MKIVPLLGSGSSFLVTEVTLAELCHHEGKVPTSRTDWRCWTRWRCWTSRLPFISNSVQPQPPPKYRTNLGVLYSSPNGQIVHSRSLGHLRSPVSRIKGARTLFLPRRNRHWSTSLRCPVLPPLTTLPRARARRPRKRSGPGKKDGSPDSSLWPDWYCQSTWRRLIILVRYYDSSVSGNNNNPTCFQSLRPHKPKSQACSADSIFSRISARVSMVTYTYLS